MSTKQAEQKEKPTGSFGVIGRITESIAWLQIVASPLLFGAITGAVIYLVNPTPARLIVGGTCAAFGLFLGVLWANKQWKGKGTIWFMSRITATPELNRKEPTANTISGQNEEFATQHHG